MDSSTVAGIARTVLAGLGGILVTKGYLDDATLQQLVGALVVIGTGVWSAFSKKKAADAVSTAAQTGVDSTKK